MPHDKNGQLVQPGDHVTITFRVTDITTGEDYCNCHLESVEGMPPTGTKLTISAVNTRQTEKVEG